MLALAIVIAVLVLIALLRFGVIVEYSEVGFELWAKAGFLKFKVVGEDVKEKPKKKKKKKKPKDRKVNIKEMMPGSLSEFADTLKAVFNTLRRFKRRLLIKQLTLYYTSAGEDPVNTALQFGAANAVSGMMIPKLKNSFRIRRLDFRTGFDFTSQEQKIYAKAILSIAVWEVLYTVFALFPLIVAIFKKAPKTVKEKQVNNDRKDGQSNGKETDQRFNGNNDAKDEGND